MEQTNVKAEDIQRYAWNYFELHANQRMSLFKFFITLAVFMAASLGATLVQRFYFVGIVLGALLVVISFVFCKLDERVRVLIKNSEAALKTLERAFPNPNAPEPCEPAAI